MAKIRGCTCCRRRYYGCRTPANIAAAVAVLVLLPTAIALLAVGASRALKTSNDALVSCGCNFSTTPQQLIEATGTLAQNAPVVMTFSCQSVDAFNCYRSVQSNTYKNAIMAGIGAVLLVASLIPMIYFCTCSQRPDVAYGSADDQFMSRSAPFAKHVDAPSQQRMHEVAFNSNNV